MSADSSAQRGPLLPIISVLASGLALFFLSDVLPVESHADDWPGPGVGAAIGLELGAMAALAAMILALVASRPRAPAQFGRAALAFSVFVYGLVGICLSMVGTGPFCGNTVALAGAPPPASSILSTCGLVVASQFSVPLLVVAAIVVWRQRRRARA